MTNISRQQLHLLYLADSALPIGAAAHSFGLETLVAMDVLSVDELAPFLHSHIREAGAMEGLFCRVAYRLQSQAGHEKSLFEAEWTQLNARLSALKPARESRAASTMLGRRFLRLVLELEPAPALQWALHLALQGTSDAHHSTAFGLAGGVLHLDEEMTVLAYLQQSIAGLVSACQRLMPLGQSRASRIIWELQPALIDAARCSQDADMTGAASTSFTPLADVGGMRHPGLRTRLFMS